MKTLSHILSIAGCMMLMAACSSGGSSYSILPTDQSFTQSNSSVVNGQMDILWVIDNSSSMQPLQTDLTSNFNSFINQFQAKNYDFHMAVTTTEAYKSGAFFNNDPTYATFRDGLGTNLTGIYDILPTTLNLVSTFVTNATQGDNGSGDERAFSSFKAALNSSNNAGFLRTSSFLAIIILSDEDDFSDPTRPEDSWQYSGGIPDHDYSDPTLETVDSYVSYLETLTNTSGALSRFSVSAIAVLDSTCLATHVPDSPSSIIGQRYMSIANETNGVLGSICDASYASSLVSIQQKIAELGTQFYLSRTPDVSSIVVEVNSVLVPQDATNGWTYNSGANSIVFHGTAVPAGGASIQVNFNPTTLSF